MSGQRLSDSEKMKLVLSTHNVRLTKAIEDHIMERVEKLKHFEPGAVETRVNIEYDTTKSPEKQFKCSMRMGIRGPDLFAEDSEGDLYAAIDLVAKKIEQQIRTRQNKKKARRHADADREE